jgi:preprotein translocase subunit SecE
VLWVRVPPALLLSDITFWAFSVQQESRSGLAMGANKYIHLTFALGMLLIAFLLFKTGDWIWSYFAKPNELLLQAVALGAAVVIGVGAYRSKRVFASAEEVTEELKKVTWPTRKETYYATIVVIVTVLIATLILSTFDAIWAFLAGKILK